MEKSSIEILTQFAKKNNFECWTSRNLKRHYITPNDSFLNSKYFIMEIPSDAHTYYYCASDSFAAKAFSTSTYSGIYRGFSNLICPSLKIRKRFWVDHLSFNRRIKLGNPEFDKSVQIQCNDRNFAQNVASLKVGSELLKFNDCISPFDIIIEPNFMSFNAQIESKSIIGMETNSWIINEDELGLLLNKGIKLLNLIKNKPY